MLSRKTVFVLGAGASVDFGMPLGTRLQANIQRVLVAEAEYLAKNATRIASTVPIFAALRNSGMDTATAANAIQYVAEGVTSALSVDTFLHNNGHHPAAVDCGKLAIVRAIGQAEADSPLVDGTRAARFCREMGIKNTNGIPDEILALRSSYLSVIWDELSPTHTRESVDSIFDNVAFVNFNYDRSLEEGCKILLMRGFGLPEADALNIVDAIEVQRPYGSPHGSVAYSKAAPRFGEVLPQELGSAGANIRTFTETIDSNRANTITRLMDSVEVVVFLGFGFHDQNVQLLRPKHMPGRHVFFSFFDGSDPNAIHYEHVLKKQFALNTGSGRNYEVRHFKGSSSQTLRHFQRDLFRGAP